jgi:hypothetical protein
MPQRERAFVYTACRLLLTPGVLVRHVRALAKCAKELDARLDVLIHEDWDNMRMDSAICYLHSSVCVCVHSIN